MGLMYVGVPAPRASLPDTLTLSVHTCGPAADTQPVPAFHTQMGLKDSSGMLGRSAKAWTYHIVVLGHPQVQPQGGPQRGLPLFSQNTVTCISSNYPTSAPGWLGTQLFPETVTL